MIYLLWIAGLLLAWAWVWQIAQAAFGIRKIADISRPEWDREPATAGGNLRVSIVVPACNEAVDIEQTLIQLLALDYENYEVIAVNDRSIDATGKIMDRVAATVAAQGRLTVIHIAKLPEGWLGKPHAMWTAANQSSGDWILFTDADVLFKPDSLRRAIAYAEAEPADHLVLFPRIIMKSPGERMMIAFFQTMFTFGHRPWKVADPKAKDHIGVGAFNLVRRNVYEAIGTYKTLRFEVVDDMKLGKVVKTAGYAQRNVFGDDLISIYWARGTMGVVNNLTKNAFALMSFQWPRALASCFAVAFLNLGPFLGIWLAHGWGRLPYALALACLAATYAGMSTKSSIPPYYVLLHPVSSVLFIYTILRSTYLTLKNGGVEWRGTRYSLEELRAGLV